MERVIKRDMASLFGIRSVNDLEKLFIYICLNSGGHPEIVKDAGLSSARTTREELIRFCRVEPRLPEADSKRWVAGEADLSKFAGRTILLRLESNPGPNHDTTCDSSFWAEVTGSAQA